MRKRQRKEKNNLEKINEKNTNEKEGLINILTGKNRRE